MKDHQGFIEYIQGGYATKDNFIYLGAALLDGQATCKIPVTILQKNLNRHGLIAGATGTEKTKNFQILAGNLSNQESRVLMMGIKGDLNQSAKPAEPNEKPEAKHEIVNYPKAINLIPEIYPVFKFYDTKEALTPFGIGEALISAIGEKRKPSPLAASF